MCFLSFGVFTSCAEGAACWLVGQELSVWDEKKPQRVGLLFSMLGGSGVRTSGVHECPSRSIYIKKIKHLQACLVR